MRFFPDITQKKKQKGNKDGLKCKSMKNKCASLPATKNAKETALFQIGGESLRSNKVKFGRIPPYDSLTR